MLKRLRLKDFKSFVDEEVTLAPLTLLVGANASGKSNFLDALRFLHATNFDLGMAEILNGEERAGPDAWPGIRGRAPEAARVGTSCFTIESTWLVPHPDELPESRDFRPGGKRVNVTHGITCRTGPHPRLDAESMTKGDGDPLFKTGGVSGNRIEVPWKPMQPSRSENASSMLLDADRTLLWTILGSITSASPQVPEQVSAYATGLATALRLISVLDIRPEVMRGYGRRGTTLGVDGSNVSGVLAQLCDEPEAKRGFVDWLAEFCAPEITDLDFVEIKELGDVMAMFVEKGGKRISARSLSDGTLRFLGILLALRTAEPGTVILMEEVDTGLHPTRVRLLVEYLETVTREREIQVIATTHSPVILQWLSPEALRSSLVFGRVPEHEGTLVRRLGDLPHFDEVAQHKGIDELFTTGWMEMAL
ncbi:AAA family ATPase [Archangium sp.]|uniref:AAA family ATPase n=1 Tax=Archangium sp. TaxID=1872627 RepID=UPI002D472696|nr:AAA family ATPase [Archangium sp.]HYO53552.1 AAA family ATPase [Archangium sp.]